MTSEDPVDYKTIGRRIRQRRLELGLSTTKLAAKAGIARYTLIRIEQGLPSKPKTIERIRHQIHLFTDQLNRPFPATDKFVISKQSDLRWNVSLSKDRYQKQIVDDDQIHVDDAEERHRLGELGFQPFFTSIMESELPNGVTKQALMELHKPSWVDSHFGEEFVYCLHGPVVLRVDDIPTVLETGDSICFDANLPHQYEPGFEVGKGVDPALILVVVALRPDERKRRAKTRD